ncbi:MAG: carbamoyltransferase, partial [Chloroflexota bacterium]|nr:carbamoyltransferase [Chloroflexota bacterium]
MYILGINAYHGGASACLINGGKLVAAVEEERFSRIKYWAGFPVQAIRFVLREAGIQPQDLDHIGISRNPTANLVKKALYAFTRRPSLNMVRDRLNNSMKVGNLKTVFCERMEVDPASLKAQFHNVEHHRAHMASAFFVSPFEEASIFSVYVMGDFVSTIWCSGKCANMDVR